MKQNRPDVGAIFEVADGMSAADKSGYLGDETVLLQGVGMPGDCTNAAHDDACYGIALGAAEAGVQGKIDTEVLHHLRDEPRLAVIDVDAADLARWMQDRVMFIMMSINELSGATTEIVPALPSMPEEKTQIMHISIRFSLLKQFAVALGLLSPPVIAAIEVNQP